MPLSTIAAVVLDVGQVLIRLDFRQIAECLGMNPTDDAETLMGKITHWDLYDSFERGGISSEAFREKFSALVGHALDEDAYLRVWNSVLREEVPGIPDLLGEVAKRYPLYALTNSNPDHGEYLFANYPWLAHFLKVFTSYDVGFRKPEPEIYQAVLREVAFPPEQILFVDDRPENIDGARAVGLKAELCRQSPEDLLRIFRQYRIIG